MRQVTLARGLPDTVQANFPTIVRNALPFQDNATFEHHFTSDDQSITALWSTNEPLDLVLPEGDAPVNFGVGNFAPDAIAGLRPTADLHKAVNALTGRVCVVSLDRKANSVAIANTLARIDPLFIYTDPDHLIVSPFPGVVDAVLMALEETGFQRAGVPLSPFSNAAALNGSVAARSYSYLNAGFYCDDYTIYPGVEAFVPSSTLFVSPGGQTLETDYFDHISGAHYSAANHRDTVREMAASLVSACANLPVANGRKPRLLLSGGMDSRLLAAALHKSGVEFDAVTYDGGSANASDVYCARLTAETLGFELDVQPRFKAKQEAGPDEADFARRVEKTNAASDHTIIALGNLGLVTKYANTVSLNGMGGEILRGGYAKSLAANARFNTAEDFLVSKWVRFGKLFRDGAHESYLESLRGFLNAHGLSDSREDMVALIESAYLWVRQGRWASTIARVGTLARNVQYPFLDNAFVSQLFSVPAERRLGDQLHFELLEELHAPLVEIPFANDHYGFHSEEQNAAQEARYPQAFINPQKDTAPKLDWRADWLNAVGPYLRNNLTAPERANSPLFDVVDRDNLVSMFENETFNRGHRFPLFAMDALTRSLDETGLGAETTARPAASSNTDNEVSN